MSDFTLQNPVFATYVVAACLMMDCADNTH